MKRLTTLFALMALAVYVRAVGDQSWYNPGGGSSAPSGVSPGTTPVTGGTNNGVFYQSAGKITNGTSPSYDGTAFEVGTVASGNFVDLYPTGAALFAVGGVASFQILPNTLDLFDSSGRNTAIIAATGLSGGSFGAYDTAGPTLRSLVRGIGDVYFNPSAGQVGIGTTTPTEMLDVLGTGGSYALRVSTVATTGTPVALGVTNSGNVTIGNTLTVSGNTSATSLSANSVTMQTNGTAVSPAISWASGYGLFSPSGSSMAMAVNGLAVSTWTSAGLSLASLATGALPAAITITTTNISATGTPSATTYLRGDNSWATVASGVTVGNAVSGGIAQSVIFEDASQNIASTSTVKISTSTGQMTLTQTLNGTAITGTGIVTGSAINASADGAVGAPALAITSNANGLGFYRVGNNRLGVVVNGAYFAEFGIASGTNQFLGPAGSASKPGWTDTSGGNNGMFIQASAVSGSIGGTEMMRLTSTGLRIGAASNPAYALDVTGNVQWTGGIVGIGDGSSAGNGTVGQTVSSTTIVFANTAGTGAWGNVASASITAGDWDVSACATLSANSSTITDYEVVASTFTGNTTTDHVQGYNWVETSALPTAAANSSLCVPRYVVRTAGSLTMYVKVKAAFSVGNPQVIGTIVARRIR